MASSPKSDRLVVAREGRPMRHRPIVASAAM
jgi:hypothetical protein